MDIYHRLTRVPSVLPVGGFTLSPQNKGIKIDTTSAGSSVTFQMVKPDGTYEDTVYVVTGRNTTIVPIRVHKITNAVGASVYEIF